MKIGFDAKRVFFNNSGLGNYSRGAVEALAKYFSEDHYVLFSPKEGNPLGFHVPDGVETIFPNSIINKKLHSFWRSYNMSGAISKYNLDIFHGLSNELPLDIRNTHIKSVVTMHDIIFVHFPELYKPFDRYLYTKKYSKSCANADRIIAISVQTKDDLINTWGIREDKIDVVYQGCNPMFYNKVDLSKKDIVRKRYNLPNSFILSVGTIEERKNLMRTVVAMAEGRIDTELVACGRHTPYADKVMEYATKHGIANKIHMIHKISFTDLPAIYQMADVMVYASIYEGFGIPILEAMNSGTPVITTKGGVFPETGGDACIYIDPNSTENMIQALDKAIYDTEIRHNMIEKGYGYAQNFRDDKVAKNLNVVYKKML